MKTIFVCRKPICGTNVQNALAYGSAGLNINASRVGVEYGGQDLVDTAKKEGRWPPNVLLQHRSGCVHKGTRAVAAASVDGPAPIRRTGVHAASGGHQKIGRAQPAIQGYGGPDGLEQVDDWACVPGCPIPFVDGQSRGSITGHRSTTSREAPVEGTRWLSNNHKSTEYPGESGGVSRFFKQIQGKTMATKMPEDLRDYLSNMIGTPELPGVYWELDEGFDAMLGGLGDNSVQGVILNGQPTPEQSAEILRVLMPGAHLMLVAPDEEPIGFTGACIIEDAGFEIRDSILWVTDASNLHYVAKPARSEREAGCHDLKGKTGFETVERVEGSAGMNNPRADAGRTADVVKNFHPCLHPDALVLTDTGYLPISEVLVGVSVFSADGVFHKVEHVSQHPYTSDRLYEISVRGTNYTTQASDNHPFLIWRPIRKGNALVGGDVVWLEAQEIRKGDYTMTPVLVEPPSPSLEFQNFQNQLALDDNSLLDLMFLFGLWVAEGVALKAGHGLNRYPSFTLHQDETDLIERIESFFGKRGFNVGVYPKPGARAVQVVAFDSEIGAEFVRLGGMGASTKRLHPVVFQFPHKHLAEILHGWLAGDGGKVRTYWQGKTVSPDLASQFRVLGEAVGYKTNLHHFAAVPGQIQGRQFKSTLPTYQLRFYLRDLTNTHRKPVRPARMVHEGVTYRLSYVKSVTPMPYVGNVVNLSVEGSPTFQTAVGMSHNTVKPISLMERLLADIPKDIVVLDPFLGSGTTGIACVKTGHSFVGIEMGPEYLEIADTRIRYWDSLRPGVGAKILSDHVPEQEPESESDSETFGFFDFFSNGSGSK